jgi:hypothetical protein
MLWTKRAHFILTALVLSLGLLATQLVTYNWRYQAILALSFLTYILSAWVLYEELADIKWLTCLILPCAYTAGVALFYFLLPERILTRLAILIAFGIGMYAILLTENIFSIAAVKTIQLLRAAQAVSLLMSLITAFFLYDTIFSFKFQLIFNFLFVFFVSLPLFFQAFWTVTLTKNIDKSIIIYSLSLSLLTGELSLALSFWPLPILLSSLFIVAFFYITVSLIQHQLTGRLFAKTYQEYLQIALVVLIVVYFMASWGGS